MSEDTILSVDPGIRGCGVALFRDEDLERAAYVPNPAKRGNGPEECARMGAAVIHWTRIFVLTLCVEWPRIHTQGQRKGDPNDLLALAGVDSAIAAGIGFNVKIVRYFPEQWKGTLDADVMTARIESRLSEEERARIEPGAASLRHNTVDAIGIGLHYLKRLDRKRVYPGAT